MTIRGYDGFGVYTLNYRSTNPPVSGVSGGPFSNTPEPGGTPPRPGGRITLSRARMGLAFINAWNRSTSKAIGVAGVMNGVWPR